MLMAPVIRSLHTGSTAKRGIAQPGVSIDLASPRRHPQCYAGRGTDAPTPAPLRNRLGRRGSAKLMSMLTLPLLVLLCGNVDAGAVKQSIRRPCTPMPAASNSRQPLHVKIDSTWYNLAGFKHPGGLSLLERHAGADITHLFYSNHFAPSLELLSGRQVNEETVMAERCPVAVAAAAVDAHSELYRELKQVVHAHLVEHGIEWRHSFSYRPYFQRFGLLCVCLAARLYSMYGTLGSESPEGQVAAVIAAVAAGAYGLLTGRQTWTHAHNGVHNPERIPPGIARLLYYDFIGILDVWSSEHHAHHAHTNCEGDPDADWWQPLFSYRDVARLGGSAEVGLVATLAYPFLVPVMLIKSLAHMVRQDPNGRATLRKLWPVAPLRFGLDCLLLGPPGFALALGVATTYILGTFVATHQAGEHNHAFERADCWMVRQMRATNNVWPQSRLWSQLCGGINLHIEHHLFPHISNDELHHIVPVVRAFARKHELPYQTFSPLKLGGSHTGFLIGPRKGGTRAGPDCPAPLLADCDRA